MNYQQQLIEQIKQLGYSVSEWKDNIDSLYDNGFSDQEVEDVCMEWCDKIERRITH